MTAEPSLPKQNFFQLCASPEFWQALGDRTTIVRALKVALVIGTILVLINQLDVMLAGQWPPIWKLLLTYCVPYGVSSYSVAAFRVAQAGA